MTDHRTLREALRTALDKLAYHDRRGIETAWINATREALLAAPAPSIRTVDPTSLYSETGVGREAPADAPPHARMQDCGGKALCLTELRGDGWCARHNFIVKPAAEPPAPPAQVLTAREVIDELSCHEGGNHTLLCGCKVCRRELIETDEALRAEVIRLQEELATYKTLAKVGRWHNDCRPNRVQAARAIENQQSVIGKMADAVSEANRLRETAEAEAQALREQLKAARDMFWPHEDDSIEAMLYEVRNGKTENYVRECAKELVALLSPAQEHTK
jgi:hypothetical protein